MKKNNLAKSFWYTLASAIILIIVTLVVGQVLDYAQKYFLIEQITMGIIGIVVFLMFWSGFYASLEGNTDEA